VGAWGRTVQPPKANGALGAEPSAPSDFHNFSIKMKHFEVYLNLNLCFKTYYDTG